MRSRSNDLHIHIHIYLGMMKRLNKWPQVSAKKYMSAVHSSSSCIWGLPWDEWTILLSPFSLFVFLILLSWVTRWGAVCLCIWFSVSLCKCLYTKQKNLSRSHYENLSISTLMLLSIYLSINLSIYLLSLCLSANLSTYLPTYLPTSLSIYLSIYLSICLSIYLSICMSFYLSIYLSVYQSTKTF